MKYRVANSCMFLFVIPVELHVFSEDAIQYQWQVQQQEFQQQFSSYVEYNTQFFIINLWIKLTIVLSMYVWYGNFGKEVTAHVLSAY